VGLGTDIAGDEVALGQRFLDGLVPVVQRLRTAPAGAVPLLGVGVERGFEHVVAVDAEHQAIVVARQDCSRVLRRGEDGGHAPGLDAARQVQHVAEVDEGFVRMLLQRPLHDAAAEQRLLRRALRHFDIGVHRAVVVVQRVAGGKMFLGIADGNDWRRQRDVAKGGRRFGIGADLRHEAGAGAQQRGQRQRGDACREGPVE
jgi:hypothetical protein